jgi:hypothetical protein
MARLKPAATDAKTSSGALRGAWGIEDEILRSASFLLSGQAVQGFLLNSLLTMHCLELGDAPARQLIEQFGRG